jgi:AraC-like DNA-binding protein
MPGYIGFARIPPFNSRVRNNHSLQNKHTACSCHYLSSGKRNSRPKPSSFKSPNIFHYQNASSFDPDQQLIYGDWENHSGPDFKFDAHQEISSSKNSQHSFLIFLRSEDSGILRYKLGEKYYQLLNSYLYLVKKKLNQFGAENILYQDNLVVANFASAKESISFMLALKKSLHSIADKIALKIVLKQGPFSRCLCEELRTDTFFFYKINEKKPVIDYRVIAMAGGGGIFQAEAVNVLVEDDQRKLKSLLKIIRENWQNPFFNVTHLCERISSSKSRLYRRCKELAGTSPIRVIKEYRLLRCLSSLRSQKSITKILYDSGFNSPSYFSRCFKKRFGISPRYYQKHLI